ncbi:hypothetical protein [Methylicorpusculum sp.]|uniref:hypothetical protein n=1 Tax=Methylicorpusculum sp. TaxID=2713644 RepID=UPI00271B89CA|nr:hypothetical protein [Methylicorpusculum sp.]MDO8844082.1 hypothetical protein [Methylicorpusculum sp.]
MTPENGQKPRLLVIAGPNGAGKTTVTERGLAHEWFTGYAYINPDFIARDEFGVSAQLTRQPATPDSHPAKQSPKVGLLSGSF